MRRTLAIVLTLACATPLWASSKNAGTSGGQFLKIGAGARPTSMGDAFVAVADDVNAVYYNPAGIALLSAPEITAMHTQYFQGLNYDYGAFVHPLKSSAIGISAATLKTDAIARRGTDESLQGTFENQDAAYAISYAHTLGSSAALGVNARWIREQIDTASAATWCGDVGVIKRFERPYSVGLAVRHIGGSIKFNDEGDPLPLTVDAGASTRLINERLLLAVDARNVRDSGTEFGFGAEWNQPMRRNLRFALRAGYNSANTDANASGLSIGAGAGYRRFDMDFAWIPFGDLGNTFRYAAHVKF